MRRAFEALKVLVGVAVLAALPFGIVAGVVALWNVLPVWASMVSTVGVISFILWLWIYSVLDEY